MLITKSTCMQICTTMGLEVPISVSMKLGDINNLFRRIIEAAQRPHLSIPETELGKSTKQHQKLIQRSLGIAVGSYLSLASSQIEHSFFPSLYV